MNTNKKIIHLMSPTVSMRYQIAQELFSYLHDKDPATIYIDDRIIQHINDQQPTETISCPWTIAKQLMNVMTYLNGHGFTVIACSGLLEYPMQFPIPVEYQEAFLISLDHSASSLPVKLDHVLTIDSNNDVLNVTESVLIWMKQVFNPFDVQS